MQVWQIVFWTIYSGHERCLYQGALQVGSFWMSLAVALEKLKIGLKIGELWYLTKNKTKSQFNIKNSIEKKTCTEWKYNLKNIKVWHERRNVIIQSIWREVEQKENNTINTK